MHWDLKNLPALNFHTFLHGFENLIIETLSCRYADQLKKNQKEILTMYSILILCYLA